MGCIKSKTSDEFFKPNASYQESDSKSHSNLSTKNNKLTHTGVHELKQNYKINNSTKVLGAGSFGKVFLSNNIADPTFQVAIKVLNKRKLKDNLDSIKEEVAILTKLDHPNIVKYYETYDDLKYIYLVMEYCDGGELFDMLAKEKDNMLNESDTCKIMKKLFRAINHCHASGVVHRDIKPENIMVGKDKEIKLIDFGLSRQFSKNFSSLSTVAGTPYYMAPEVFDQNYNYQCDLWSLGVLMYVLLSGYLPFQGENKQDVFQKISKAKYDFNYKEFESVSSEAKDLIKKLLIVDPKQRITGEQALNHPWFIVNKNIEKGSKEDKLDPDLVQKLKEYKGVSALKKAAMNILVKMSADDKEINKIREVFMEIDHQSTGYITAQDLKQAFRESNLQTNDKEIDNIIDEVDYGGQHKINYTEFLAATLSVNKIIGQENKMKAIFKQFDTENTGHVTPANIQEAMHKLGHTISQKELNEILEKHNFKKQGYITFSEFKHVFENIK